MKTPKIILLVALSGSAMTSQAQTVEFLFNAETINGNGTLGSSFQSAVDGETTATLFNLDNEISGLTITVTPSQSDISHTGNGLGITSGGTLDALGDALTFQFNQAITLDSLDMGDFTGSGGSGEDSVSIVFSNSNPAITLVGGDFDNNSSDTIAFTSGNALQANETFKINRVDGVFAIEGFTVTVVPEPNTFALLAGFFALASVMFRRRAMK